MSRRKPKRLSEGRSYPGRQCPHVEAGHCERCRDPMRFLRRFRSRFQIKDPKRLHEVSRAAKRNNPKPPPRVLK